jgi:hypothetical protein
MDAFCAAAPQTLVRGDFHAVLEGDGTRPRMINTADPDDLGSHW